MKIRDKNILQEPQLRFPKFSENVETEYCEKKLGEIASYKNGLAHEPNIHESGSFYLISLNSISIEGNLKNDHKRVRESDDSLQKNDIVMILSDVAHGYFLGLTAIIPKDNKYVLNQRIGRLRIVANVSVEFVRAYLNANQRYFKLHGQGSSQQNLSKGDILKFPIKLPTLPEQRKIADFLMAVDGRIGQLIQKKALLEDYKKGVMQQLFTQAIRFKDDHGNDFPEWEENEFELIAEKAKAKHNPTKSEKEWPCVELESLSQNTGKLLETFSSSEQKSIKNKFSVGEVLFGKLRPYLRKFLHADFDGVCSSEIWVLRGKTVTNAYLFQLIQTHKFNQAANVSSGSKMPRSDWDFLSAVPFSHPSSPDEQTKIADFLSSLDRKIENVATQITETQTFKRGLLQQMFV